MAAITATTAVRRRAGRSVPPTIPALRRRPFDAERLTLPYFGTKRKFTRAASDLGTRDGPAAMKRFSLPLLRHTLGKSPGFAGWAGPQEGKLRPRAAAAGYPDRGRIFSAR